MTATPSSPSKQPEKNFENLFFFQGKEKKYGQTAHITDRNDVVLCGKRIEGRSLYKADWESIHYRTPFGGLCKECLKAAELRLRPKAVFWYSDPFSGEIKEFPSLRAAVASAKKEHGNSTVWQLGPGDINKIVRFVEGLPALP